MLYSAYAELQPEGVKMIVDLGYPAYFATMLSLAKALGAIALVYRRFPVLTEWAYAGFAFDFVAAGWSMVAVGAGWGSLAFVAPFLLVLFASYRLAPERGRGCACSCDGCSTCRA
jgi:hypothetical protein